MLCLCRWQVQVSVYCAWRIPAHLRCTQCSILLHLMDKLVGPGLVTDLPDAFINSLTTPVGPATFSIFNPLMDATTSSEMRQIWNGHSNEDR